MILDRFKLSDRVAIVTGAGKGIGRGIALGFAEAGANVVCAARTQSDIDATADGVRALGRRALAVSCDVMLEKDLERLVAETMKEFRRIDVLVNNAGGTPPRAALSTSAQFLEKSLRFNLVSSFLLTQLVVPRMVESAGDEPGAVINISSRASDMAQTSFSAYGAAKAALNMMTRNLAAEFAPKVRINAISVGGVDTEGLKVVLTSPELSKQFNEGTPMGRPGTVEDIAAAALYLASPASNWVTGKIFQVDGGVEAPAISVPTPPL